MMGKKSKKKVKAPAVSAPSNDAQVPPAASCWICLDDGPDERGLPLVRDCSCRGTCAGFGHLSCIVKHAEHKCAQENQSFAARRSLPPPDWIAPFIKCPNCNQKYRGDLAMDLATACVDFVEREHPSCAWRKTSALHTKLGQVALYRSCANHEDKVAECEEIARSCFSLIEQMKNNPRKGTLPHVLSFEADTTMTLGNVHLDSENEAGGRKAVEYYEKAKAMKNALRNAFGINVGTTLDARIAEAKELCSGEEYSQEKIANHAETLLRNYPAIIQVHGEDSSEAIGHGHKLAAALSEAHRTIEGERLLQKICARSRQVHGHDHFNTRSTESFIETYRTRAVVVSWGGCLQVFEALCYDSSGSKCTVKGPIRFPRNTDQEVTFDVDAPVIPKQGTPVVIHGLQSATSLNGKVGDVRGYDKGSGRSIVHVEGAKKPVLVKIENLRVAFKLPEREDSSPGE